MGIGSLFSGIGGLDLACEWAGLGSTAWQLDLVNADVRRRHFPDALQVEADITTVDPLDLPRVDVLCGGFPCQDLSTAGKQAGLDGARSGLYREVLRFARVLTPSVVVLENVPGLLAYRERLDRDWRALGYGLTWVRARALDAGAPHLRARVFVVAQRGAFGGGMVDAPRDGAWTSEREREWPTPTAANPNESEDPREWAERRAMLAERHGNNGAGEPLGQAVRVWPTATAGDAKASGNRSAPTNAAHDGTSLTDAVRADRHVAGSATGPTPTTQDGGNCAGPSQWARNSDALNVAAADRPGKRLNPAWVSQLMGYPDGWTLPDGLRLDADPSPRWPRGRYPEGWDRSQVWPGFAWEAPRTLPDGPPAKGRPAQLRALGNAVVPQQGTLAIRTALEGGAAPSLFGASRLAEVT